MRPIVFRISQSHPNVNGKMGINPGFCVFNTSFAAFLWNIPSCKWGHMMVFYRHKEVIPMYR